MAKTVYNIEEIELQDGRAVTLKPLAIGRLRKFMKVWGELSKIDFDADDNEDRAFDIYVNCAGIALARELKEEFPDGVSKDGLSLSEDYQEYLEDVLDTETTFKVLEVCGGLKLNDPKLLEMAQEAAMRQAGGKN